MSPFQQFSKEFKDKKVLIFGLGTQGRGVGDAKIFSQIGAKVTVTDQKTSSQLKPSLQALSSLPVHYTLGHHQKKDILQADCIIRNASVPLNHPLLELARQHHIPIHMDASLFFSFAKPTKVIGITGTRGKSTTTHLLFHLIKAHFQNAYLGGNATSQASLELLASFDPDVWYVFELSSWQLQAFHQAKISPHLAVLTNLYPDHLLDRTFPEYVFDKTAIYAYQSGADTLFANQDDPLVQAQTESAPANKVWFSARQLPKHVRLQLPGDHNRANAAAVMQVGRYLNIPQALIESILSSFTPLPFRLEPISSINEVHFINDSTSTTPIATITAVNAYPQSIVIVGGTSKKLPTQDLVTALNHQAKAIFLLSGSGTDAIKANLDPSLVIAESGDLRQLTRQAFRLAQAGDTILFSPGFTSFELFDNEFDRGRKFTSFVKQLKSTNITLPV